MLETPSVFVIVMQDLPLCRQEEAVLASGALYFQMVYLSCTILPFSSPEFHSTQVCPTPSSLFTLSQGRNTPQRGRVGMGRDWFLADRGNGFKSILLYHYLISLTSDYWRNIVGLLQCTVFSQCQWSLQRAVECILRRGKKADWEKSSIFILISLTQEIWTPALMLLNVGGMLRICHLLYSKDAFASSPLWDSREQIIFSS